LNWLGINSKVFNVGSYRRSNLGSGQKSDFFDHNNEKAMSQRRELSHVAMDDMLNFLSHGGQCGIFDATNTTRERRDYIIERITKEFPKIPLERIMFIESVCDDTMIIESSVKSIKVKSTDYTNVDEKEAIEDFFNRIHEYEKVYQPLCDEQDETKSWIKLIDVRKRIILNRIHGYLPFRVVSLLMNNNILPRKIYLSRHGESLYNLDDKVGGDPDLSDKGKAYAKVLYKFISQQQYFDKMNLWTSTLKRTIQTSALFTNTTMKRYKQLDEIDAGLCDGMSYAQIEREMPNEFAERQKDKFNYRYPRGESYKDIVFRIEPLILEMEAQIDSLLLLTHQAITRVFYAYLLGKKPEDCVDVAIPLHTVIEIQPGPYTMQERRYDLNPQVFEELERIKNTK
jgi:broad specificity phosphatase PhoE